MFLIRSQRLVATAGRAYTLLPGSVSVLLRVFISDEWHKILTNATATRERTSILTFRLLAIRVSSNRNTANKGTLVPGTVPDRYEEGVGKNQPADSREREGVLREVMTDRECALREIVGTVQ
jgi:hypothetical protein